LAKGMGHSYYVDSPGAKIRAGLVMCIPLLLLLLASCSNPFGGNNNGGGSGQTPAATSTTSSSLLADLHWCGKPSMLFRDDGAQPVPTAIVTATAVASTTPPAKQGTPFTITSWDTVQAGLGFTVYLPASLPGGTCLVSAQATIHDPTLGGNFLIGYLLPDHTALAISEAPLITQNNSFQCSTSGGSTQTPASATATPSSPVEYCSGAKGSTSIVLSAQRSVAYLQQLFANLQPGVAWIPGT
jgi:hypothetical protein